VLHEASVQRYLCGFKGRKNAQQEVPVFFQRPWLPWEGHWFGGFPTAMALLELSLTWDFNIKALGGQAFFIIFSVFHKSRGNQGL